MPAYKTPTKYENFSEWFEWIIAEADIYDYGRYPVKGMGIWLPYGFKIRQHVINIMRNLLDETGHEEILLPILLPETIFKRESEHVRGFEEEVLWVTHGGREELDVKLVLRPTSETSISYMESFWIKSYKQLPKKYYQIVSIFRYETKMTKPMIRVREVTTFKEAHTVHEDFSDAERQVMEAINIYKRFFDTLGIPYIISRRPQWDKFAGAIYTIAFDTIYPDGKALQIGTVHNLGQTFTRVYDVKFQKKDETIDYAWQTSYGISERVIASIIAFHSDDKGLILPPIVAPYQVIVIPIQHTDQDKYRKVIEYSNSIVQKLREAGFRVYVDSRNELKPSDKYYEWELKGAPVRIEIGYREYANNLVTIFRRDTLTRKTVALDSLVDEVKNMLEEIQRSLSERAWKWFKEHVKMASDISEALEHINNGNVVLMPWCGYEHCVHEKIESIEGVDALGEPLPTSLSQLGISSPSDKHCSFCGKPALKYMLIAKRY
uniref:Proline--tRNA ligase n=1 Tax=Ignisphaera aggregans TaxID=334771 RepID=A0A7C2VB59_9CREN